MGLHNIIKGLDLPIAGIPEQKVCDSSAARRVALLGADYIGLRPKLCVAVGDTVKRGQILFEEKRWPGVRHTSPGAGTVVAIHRGERRALLSVVIELNANELSGHLHEENHVAFSSYTGRDPVELDAAAIRDLLLESGLWTALRVRPFGHVADPNTVPHSIFVTAMDTNPLAPAADVVLKGREADLETGLVCVAKLSGGKTFLCMAPRPGGVPRRDGISVEEFQGPHPAGTVGVHIHLLDPVHREKKAWHLNYQDVIAIGRLFRTGTLDVERTISLAGPAVKKPRLVRTRLGASVDDLVAGELKEGENRVLSGSVLSGRAASGEALGYLGRYHHQVSVIPEEREREFLGWLKPGKDKFSVTGGFISKLFRGKRFTLGTSIRGSVRPMVPIGVYERVMPMDIMPTFLLRALLMDDVERAEQLGCLELDEEDLALCTFVCPSKIDYGSVLRRNLDIMEKEG